MLLTHPASHFPSKGDKLHKLCVVPAASAHPGCTAQLPQMSWKQQIFCWHQAMIQPKLTIAWCHTASVFCFRRLRKRKEVVMLKQKGNKINELNANKCKQKISIQIECNLPPHPKNSAFSQTTDAQTRVAGMVQWWECSPSWVWFPNLSGLSLLVLYSTGTPVFPSLKKPTFDLSWEL